MYKSHQWCRACRYAEPSGPPGIKAPPSGEKLIPVFDLGLQPLSNDFRSQDEEHAGFAPLKVLFCPKCLLAQLSIVVNPEILYAKNYAYVTSQSQMMMDHFKSIWDCIWDRHPNPDNVLEIGSNDGTLLKFISENGASSVIGIDPAQNLCDKATQNGIRSICSLFDASSASMLAATMPKVDAVIARHVFCHVDDWHDFIKNLDTVCQKETLVAIEVPYVLDLMNQVQWDTVYHEHLSYMNVKAMVALLDGTVFKLHAVQHFPIHSGAIVLYLRRRDFNGPCDESVQFYLKQEEQNLNPEAWATFDKKVRYNIERLKETVELLVNNGQTVCGFGASAKSTVWVNACGFTKKHLKFITDTTPQKQGKISPGSDIPIVDPGALMRELPESAVLFSWNYLSEVLATNILYTDRGGKFIVPVPTLKVVP